MTYMWPILTLRFWISLIGRIQIVNKIIAHSKFNFWMAFGSLKWLCLHYLTNCWKTTFVIYINVEWWIATLKHYWISKFSRSSYRGNDWNQLNCRKKCIIGVWIDTYVFYQSVLEKKPIGQVYREGLNVTSQM